MLRRLPTPIVFDHMGKGGLCGLEHPSHGIIRGLLDQGRAWVKLSGAYMNGPPTYDVATKVAQAFVKAAPERLVWGSDWPHPRRGPAAGRRGALRPALGVGAGRGDAQSHPGHESGSALRVSEIEVTCEERGRVKREQGLLGYRIRTPRLLTARAHFTLGRHKSSFDFFRQGIKIGFIAERIGVFAYHCSGIRCTEASAGTRNRNPKSSKGERRENAKVQLTANQSCDRNEVKGNRKGHREL